MCLRWRSGIGKWDAIPRGVARCLQPIYKHLLVGMQIRQLSWILIDLFTRLITCDRVQCRSTSLHYIHKVHAYYASVQLFIFPSIPYLQRFKSQNVLTPFSYSQPTNSIFYLHENKH